MEPAAKKPKGPMVYLVSLSGRGKKKFRRLHKSSLPRGKQKGITVLDWEEYGEVDRIPYDDHCHLCWPPEDNPAVDAKEAKRRNKPDLLWEEEEVSSVIDSSSSSPSPLSDSD